MTVHLLPRELRDRLAAIVRDDILNRMPISDDEACSWMNIHVELIAGYKIHCSHGDFVMDYVPGEVWKLALHALDEHGMRLEIVRR